MDLDALIRVVPDFPKPGIAFKDITPLLGDAAALAEAIRRMTEPHRGDRIAQVVGIESRGFILGVPVALALGAGFVPARKPGKLPWQAIRECYGLEYGTDAIELHQDSIRPGQRVLIVDDVLATGGTAGAAIKLVERLGGSVVGVAVLVELGFLGGRAKLSAPVSAVLRY
jgi:adenine phosphoribosyltransferase